MKIKVIKCNDIMLWYYNKVGSVFAVKCEEDEVYWCREGGEFNCLNWIHKADAEVL